MNVAVTIYDYVDITSTNIIKTWFDELAPKTKAKLNSRLNALEQINRNEWGRYGTEVLKGDKDGLVAVRVEYQGIQYRLLGYDGPFRGEFTLLACGTERNNKYIPLDIGNKSFVRKNTVEENPVIRRIKHDFG
jgi:hypothetical protein